MEDKKVKEFRTRVTNSIITLAAKDATIDALTPDTAEDLLIYAECIVSCLTGFVFCARHDAMVASGKSTAMDWDRAPRENAVGP